MEETIEAVHGDPYRISLWKISIPAQQISSFDQSDVKFNEVAEVVRKARATSTPGPSGTTYKIYKNFPKLLKRLFKLLRTLWKKAAFRSMGITRRLFCSKKLIRVRTVSGDNFAWCRRKDLLVNRS